MFMHTPLRRFLSATTRAAPVQTFSSVAGKGGKKLGEKQAGDEKDFAQKRDAQPLAQLQKATKMATPGGSSHAVAVPSLTAASVPFGAPILPFHHAFPVHSLAEARAFYKGLLGCEEGRSSKTWIDYNFWGHQIVCHWAGDDYRARDYFNSVDIDMVPVPHFGVCLTVPQFHALADKLKAAKVRFVVEPHLRFPGAPGEQWTMFFKDPSGNNLEFKALTTQENLYA